MKEISINDGFGEHQSVQGSNLIFSPQPEYIACQEIDLAENFNFENKSYLYIVFFFNKVENVGATLRIEDKRKSINKRSLRSSTTVYEGPSTRIANLMSPQWKNYYLTISQSLHSEENIEIGCKNYPTKDFKSYRDCDENFVYNEMKETYKIMPFWATRDMNEVTKLTYASDF